MIKFKPAVDLYRKTLKKIIFIGLIVFINGFFFFPEISGAKTTFYLLILLPGILLLPLEIRDFPFRNPVTIAFMALSCYLCISYFWSNSEDSSRSFFFFLKQVIFIFVLLFCCFIASKDQKNFLTILLVSMVVIGSIFASASIAEYYFILSNHTGGPTPFLMGFSLNDSNKSSMIYTIHLAICTYFLLIDSPPYKTKTASFLLIVSIIIDLYLIVLTQSKASWLVIPIIPIFFLMKRNKIKRQPIIWTITLTIVTIASIQFELVAKLAKLSSFTVRIELIHESILQMDGNYVTGIGLQYKQYIYEASRNRTQLHPHNLIVDIFRFGGAIGLTLFIIQFFAVYKSYRKLPERKKFSVVIFWYVTGTILLSFYGQQPLTRPGYIWFLYWIPSCIVIASYLLESTQKAENNRLETNKVKTLTN